MKNNTNYTEIQKFRQIQLWGPFILLFIFMLSIQVYFIIKHPLSLTTPMTEKIMALSISMVIYTVVGILIYISKLEVKVNINGLYVRFFPLEIKLNHYSWDEIKEIEIIKTMRPLLDYGGWGLRYGKKSKAYIISGKQCLKITLQNGKIISIGTQQPDKFQKILKFYQKKTVYHL